MRSSMTEFYWCIFRRKKNYPKSTSFIAETTKKTDDLKNHVKIVCEREYNTKKNTQIDHIEKKEYI